MFFTVGIMTVQGNFPIKKFFNHDEAFNYAINLEMPTALPYVMERQWSVPESKMVEKMYFIRIARVYKSDNSTEPIYSNLDEFKETKELRWVLTHFIKKAIEVYEYHKLPCLYSSEFIYCMTHKEMQGLKEVISTDPLIVAYAALIGTYITEIESAVSWASFKLDFSEKSFKNMKPGEVLSFLEQYKRRVKDSIIANVYGGRSYINFWTANRLT
jgi:hypothetical protein